MKRILVTASSGNIGRQITQIFTQQNIHFTSGVNSSETGPNVVYVDYNNEESLKKAFEGHDIIFLLFPMHANMVQWAHTAVQAAQETQVQHLVRSSGAGADSSSNFFMPRTQGQIDDIIKNSGIPYTITKPSSFMQNFINFFAHDIKAGQLYQPVGDGKMPWVDVRDIAAVNAHILLNSDDYINRELTITGNENLSYAQALDIISSTIQRPVKFIDIPPETAKEAMESFGMSAFAIDMLSSLNEIIRHGYAEGTSNIINTTTGKAPITFTQFAKDHKWAWQ